MRGVGIAMKEFYARMGDGLYVHIVAEDLQAAQRLAPPGCKAVLSKAYFYEIERKRCKVKVIESTNW